MRISDWSSDVCSSDLETKSGRISFETQLIGERPAGATPADAPIVRATVGAIKAIGLTPDVFASSTDSNIAMSIGIPAVRSEERRVGKECVSTCRSRWSQYH